MLSFVVAYELPDIDFFANCSRILLGLGVGSSINLVTCFYCLAVFFDDLKMRRYMFDSHLSFPLHQ